MSLPDQSVIIIKLADGQRMPKELVVCQSCWWYQVCPHFDAACHAEQSHHCVPAPPGMNGKRLVDVELPA